MADDTLALAYEHIIGDMVRGSPSTTPEWDNFFQQTSGNFQERIQQVLDEHGYVPTKTQFERAKTYHRSVDVTQPEKTGYDRDEEGATESSEGTAESSEEPEETSTPKKRSTSKSRPSDAEDGTD